MTRMGLSSAGISRCTRTRAQAHRLHAFVHMPRCTRLFALIAVLAVLQGCASLGALSLVRPPRFREDRERASELRLLGPSTSRPFGGASLRLWARVENPNPFSLTLSTVAGRLFLEGT